MNLHKTASKIYKTGFFHSIELTKHSLTFKDCYGTIYVLHTKGANFPYFRIGHIAEWKEFKPTYESEYNSCYWIECAAFIDHYKPTLTNNPDFILRASLSNLFPTIQ